MTTHEREYRMDELAEAAGVPVRTVRFYRERKLLPAPRREGRITWYNDHHLARLRTITALLERGHTLGGIAELMDAWESGRRDVGELLGLDPGLPTCWSEEEPLRLTPEGLADHYGDQATAENLATALDIGYLAVDGDDVVHVSRRLLEASAALVRGRPARRGARRGPRHAGPHGPARRALRRAGPHLRPAGRGGRPAVRRHHPAERGDRPAAPLVQAVVEAELALAIDRRLREELKR